MPFAIAYLIVARSGLLHIATRYVIWKNYSLTDWSKMIERFGLPTLVIKTDEQKTEELNNMENMAKNFGTNLWVMLDKEDDFEVQWPRVSQGHNIFKDKCDFCDSQLSKLVAGQESTSSEKAYVGAAEVHERILNAYMEQAMRSEAYYHNHVLFPFLIQHGYPLDELEFRYLALAKEEEPKNNPPPKPTSNSGEESQKNKPTASAPNANFTKPFPAATGCFSNGKGENGTLTERINALYHTECCQGKEKQPTAAPLFRGVRGVSSSGAGGVLEGQPTAAAGIDLEKLAQKAMQKVYDRKLKAGQIDRDLFLAWADHLASAALKGYGVKYSQKLYGSTHHKMIHQLKHNTHVFAAFKNHHHTNELVKALTDDKGNVRSFSQFKKAAGRVNSKYNKHWLKTEHTQALLSGQNAHRWQQIQARKHIFPTVEYVVVDDDRISPICQDLKGGVWKVDDPILRIIGPSNHWRCRSFLRSSKKKPNPKNTGEDMPKGFEHNPGITGEAFSKKHPYFTLQNDDWKKTISIAAAAGMAIHRVISTEQLHRNVKLLHALKKDDYTQIIKYESGGWVAVHKQAHQKDLKQNLENAKTMAQQGYAVEIREHIEKTGVPNPEYKINDVLSDLKTPKKSYSLTDRLKDADKKQKLNNVVYQVKGSPSLEEIKDGLVRGLKNRKKIEWVYVVYQERVVKITRKMLEDRVILKELQTVFK